MSVELMLECDEQVHPRLSMRRSCHVSQRAACGDSHSGQPDSLAGPGILVPDSFALRRQGPVAAGPGASGRADLLVRSGPAGQAKSDGAVALRVRPVSHDLALRGA